MVKYDFSFHVVSHLTITQNLPLVCVKVQPVCAGRAEPYIYIKTLITCAMFLYLSDKY